MELQIYGSRGSIPTPATEDFDTRKYGGNTTCYVVKGKDGTMHVIDAGTGIRVLGNKMMKEGFRGKANLYITHTHWDHIQGFPFFTPAYVKGNNINVYGEAKVTGDLVAALENHTEIPRTFCVNGNGGIRDVFAQQQAPRNFPAPLEFMGGLGQFIDFAPGGLIAKIGDMTVTTAKINHPGGCVSYKFQEDGKTIVIATDFEPDANGEDDSLVNWMKGADIVLADGQYERDSKINPFIKTWGHSDYVTDVELCRRAGAKNLVLSHHEPKMDDGYHTDLETRAKALAGQYGINAMLAREGATYRV